MTTDQWNIAILDLDGYLRRIGYAGPVAPDLRTLQTLHRAHVASIPFENLDVMLGRGISVELADVQAKLVDRRRGGYCYEHGVLFGAVLERIGFRVDRLLARVGDPDERPRPRSHLVLGVDTGEGQWLADVGFGSGMLAPLPFAGAGVHRQGAWQYQVVKGADDMWRLRERTATTWSTRMAFSGEPQYLVDVDAANYNTSTNPNSPFTQRVIVVQKSETRIRSLIGRKYSVERPGEPNQERMVADEEVGELLSREFGLSLTPAEVGALVDAPVVAR
ncbi:arylamine N-acetyltransferase [Kribbella sandramycini]|uniref:Arylamine N-acetyltransferase n=1 Tax=Kribbella sandramycini TaxID=60450 RepID=A0A7Y4KXH0_9ACTN|nr:arylamine N-acetyltransferase [Kribbella sandramycini]MBB6569708.1 N-hydroxyarylamine O-acetyltransferase [Kribbella sandramycini]NOL40462.1 arylamine N-acetyltransferase [Kribbella sandramycini]